MSALRRFKPYPAHKDSGVGWLGEIPAAWEAKRLKTIACVQLSNVDKKAVEGQEPVTLCNYTGVYCNERITADLEFMAATATREQVRRFALRAIAAFLDRQTAPIDALIARVRNSIDRLKEFRTALISAAVTGRMDVGEEAA